MEPSEVTVRRPSRGEVVANGITHAVGAVFSVVGLVVLAVSATRYGTARSIGGVVWGLALAGIALRLVLPRRPTGPFVALYLAIGWCVVVAAKPLLAALVPGVVVLLAAGGVAYSAGIVFYAWRSLPYAHAIWHGLVLAGSALHFAAILLYVARA